jgi:hypothetical protein
LIGSIFAQIKKAAFFRQFMSLMKITINENEDVAKFTLEWFRIHGGKI